jgi:hypothetical protein
MDETIHQKIRAAMSVSVSADGKTWLMPTDESLRLTREATMSPEEIADLERRRIEARDKRLANLKNQGGL